MANEFIIKKGLISKADSVVSGSLIVTEGVSGSFSGSFEGDGSGLTNVTASFSPTASYALTASYVETAQTASYVLDAISSSYSSFAISASYAVSASHEIIKEVSSSYADTASFAQSGDGIFSGSFSGSYEGDGSGLTNIPAVSPFPFVGDAVITGSLTISGSFSSFRIDDDDIVLGSEAGLNMSSVGPSYNVLIGERAGRGITNGGLNVIIGREAGLHSNQGRNTSIGYLAGRGWNNISGENVSLGYFSGYNAAITSATGIHNTLLGALTGRNLTSGNGNIYIGHSAGYQGAASTGNIIIGSGSLGAPAYGTPITNQLRIGHADTIVISGSLETGDITFSSTASAAYFVGDGSQLTNIPMGTSASYAATASYVETSQTASYVHSSSIDNITDYVRNDQTSSMTVLSSSFALTASYVETAQTASYVEYSNVANKPTLISGSSQISYTGITDVPVGILSSSAQIATEISGAFTADSASFSTRITTNETDITSLTAATSSYVLNSQTSSMTVATASYVETAQTASYVLNAVSSSYALTASYAVSASYEITHELSSSYAETASYVETAQTASYVLNAISSSYSTFALSALSASYAPGSPTISSSYALSSSYADTASFAQSGDGIFSGSFSGSFEGDGSGLTGVSNTIRNVSSTTTFLAAGETINCTSSGTFIVNLPTAVGIQGIEYTLVNSGTGIITLDANASETINGSLTIDLKRQYTSRTVQSDNANWVII